MKAMILSAGLGTRLKPFTNNHPKALAVVNGKTLLQRNIEYLASYGVKEIIVNVHHFPDQIIDHLKVNNNFGIEIVISDERDFVLETGGGLKKAGWFFDDHKPFVLLNVDILTDLNLIKLLEFHHANAALASLGVTNRTTSRYLLWDRYHRLAGWRNVQTGEEKISRIVNEYNAKAFSGVHIIDSRIFDLIREEGKFSMIDLYLRLSFSEKILAFEHSEGKFLDVGKPESVIMAERMFP